MTSLQRRRSTLSKLDDGLLVAAIVVGVLIALPILFFVVHTIFWLTKLVIIGLVIGLVVRFVNRRGRP